MNSVGPRIRFWRKLRGLTQEELSAKLDIKRLVLTRDVIANIETQRSSVPAEWLLPIADVLGIDTLDLFPPSDPLVIKFRAKKAKRLSEATSRGSSRQRPRPKAAVHS